MTDAITVALIVAAPPTIAALMGFRKAVVVEKKVDAVHTIANNRLTEALEKIERLLLTVERQRVEIAEQKARSDE